MEALRGFVVCVALLLFSSVVIAVDNQTAGVSDIDHDGIIDSADVCPNTPRDSLLVNPQKNIKYAGCTCDQIEEIIDTSDPCIDYFCYGEVLKLTEKTAGGKLVDCPVDECVGTTYYDFPSDGYDSCSGGSYLAYSCDPILKTDYPLCESGVMANDSSEPKEAVLVSEGVYDVIPYPKGDFKRYFLTGAELSYSYDETTNLNEQSVVEAIVVFATDEKKNVELVLANDGVPLEASTSECAEDVTGTRFCKVTWPLPTDVTGLFSYDLILRYTLAGESDVITHHLSLPQRVRRAFIADDRVRSVVGYESNQMVKALLREEEEQFIADIYDELLHKGFLEDYSVSDVMVDITTATDNADVEKNRHIEERDDGTYTVFEISLVPHFGMTLHDVTIIENIPKEIASSVDDLVFSVLPVTINSDPLIMWHFGVVDERVDLSYEVNHPVEVTGNTIVTAKEVVRESTPWHIIIPLLLIPIVAIIFVGFSRYQRRS